MILPDYGRNPISGKTRAEEIEIARAIGGRLPFDTYLSLIRRGIVKSPRAKSRRLKAKQAPRQSR